jgi:ProP effector
MTKAQHTDTVATLWLLVEKFPKAFFMLEARRKPLKIGIYSDIADKVAGAITPEELSAALRSYTRNAPGYLRAMAQPGAMRIDLEGNEIEAVTADQAASAARAVASYWARRAERKAAARAAAAPISTGPVHSSPAPMSERPRRLSLADLRQSALERRKATA